jgi:hypothetical protein
MLKLSSTFITFRNEMVHELPSLEKQKRFQEFCEKELPEFIKVHEEIQPEKKHQEKLEEKRKRESKNLVSK